MVALLLCALATATAHGQAPPKSLHPLIQKAVDGISSDRIASTLRRLEAFGTRANYSSTSDPKRGIGAARRFLAAEFKSISPRLAVREDLYRVKAQPGISRPLSVVNVIAELKGRRYPDRHILLTAHYDSINTSGGDDAPAPGVSDNASGVAALLEIARLLSPYEFDKTIVFAAFAAEEIGLVGSSLHAQAARNAATTIEAVLNSDIIGTDTAADGRRLNRAFRLFSADPNDSPSRQLARYVFDINSRYSPSLDARLIFRHDRVGRGGDHTPFERAGFPAVRFTSAVEHFTNQHSPNDTLANASPTYTAQITRVLLAAAASLALAPPTPTTNGGLRAGANVDEARLSWSLPDSPDDLAGFSILMRATTAPLWEREIFTGSDTEFRLPGVSIDDWVFGVKAIDRQGNESLVAPFLVAPAFAGDRVIEIE